MLVIIISLIFTSTVLCVPISDSVQDTIMEIRQKSIGFPNPAVGELIRNWRRESGVYPEELGTYFEGDILHIPGKDRNAITNLNARWPGRIVPYVIASTFNATDKKVIQDAMTHYRNKTCIRFVPKTSSHKDYISIESSQTGCWSYVGRIGGKQIVNLQRGSPGCVWRDTVVHELMHAIGFYHEQSRTDRDKYVTILWQNIQSGKEHNFKVVTASNHYNVPYDYKSVMHYSSKAFSKNYLDTIRPKIAGVTIVRNGLSNNDITKIRKLYSC